jgi:hypothetical protein
MFRFSARPAAMIRIDTIWLAIEPMDMRAGTETALARVVAVFGAAKPHCAYLFAITHMLISRMCLCVCPHSVRVRSDNCCRISGCAFLTYAR